MLATTEGAEPGAKRPAVTAGDAAKVAANGGDHIDWGERDKGRRRQGLFPAGAAAYGPGWRKERGVH